MAEKKGAFKLHLLNEVKDRGVGDDKISNGWDSTRRGEVKTKVLEYLNLIVAEKNCPFESADVSIVEQPPVSAPVAPDVLMSFRLRKYSEIVAKGQKLSHGDSAGGATFDTGSGIISEVFPEGASGDASFTRLVANLVIHELMHVKCDTGKSPPISDIHSGATGLDKATVSASTTLSDGCKKRIAPNLGRSVQTIQK
jgi:hypothetical protein